MLLSFVNERTKEKFIITDDLDVVCKELGWYKPDVYASGDIKGYMEKHHKPDTLLNDII